MGPSHAPRRPGATVLTQPGGSGGVGDGPSGYPAAVIAPLLLTSAALLQGPPFDPPAIVPPALSAQPRFAPFVVPPELRVVANEEGLDGAAAVLADHLARLTGSAVTVGAPPSRAGDLLLTTGYLGDAVADNPEGYSIEVFGDHVALSGATPAGVHRAASRLLQLLEQDPGSGAWMAPPVRIEDAPTLPWRGLMLDLARFPHSVESVEEAIELAYLFSLNTVQLHLSDDQAFTFPASCLPPRVDPLSYDANRGYTREDIARMVRFAEARGITLVPEIDMPAHASSLVRARPDLFGTYDADSDSWSSTGVIHMASPRALEALDELLAEVAEAFPSSPWIHLGGDEVWAPGLVDTAEFASYAAANSIPATVKDGAIGELLSHFLARMAGRVRELGRAPILWEGFHKAKAESNRVPADVVVMSWSQNSRAPEDLLREGHGVINCNWEPLYVVPAQGWASQPRHAWDWQPWALRQRYGGKETLLAGDADLRGVQICVWEQRPDAIVPSLMPLMPELATRMWGTGGELPFGAFDARSRQARDRVTSLLRPVEVEAEGLVAETGTLFGEKATLRFTAPAGAQVRYVITGSGDIWRMLDGPGTVWDGKPVTLEESALVTAQAFVEDRPVGFPTQVRFQKGTPVLRFFAHELPQGGAVTAATLDETWADGGSLIGAGVLAAPDAGRMTAINRELFAKVRDQLPLRSHVDLRPLAWTAVGPWRRIDPLRPRIWGRHAVFATGQIRIPKAGRWSLSGTARSGLARIHIGGRLALFTEGMNEARASAELEPGVYEVTIELSVPFVHEDLQLLFQREGEDEPRRALYDLLLDLDQHVPAEELVTAPRPFR